MPDLPGALRLAVRLNPLSYGVDGLRGALNGGFAFGAATDFAVLGGLGAILLAVGAYLSRRSRYSRRRRCCPMQARHQQGLRSLWQMASLPTHRGSVPCPESLDIDRNGRKLGPTLDLGSYKLKVA